MNNQFSNEMLDRLRENVASVLSSFRLMHTLGVEKMAVRIGEIYCPDCVDLLRAAALLHDITKELSVEEHCRILESHRMIPTKEQLSSPATLHSVTAALIIPERYPAFADKELIDAVKYHTTGRSGMTLCEKIIYLADYIDETRKYDDCIALRNEFFSVALEELTNSERSDHLNRVILHSLEMTLEELEKNKKAVSEDSLAAKESIIKELENTKGVI